MELRNYKKGCIVTIYVFGGYFDIMLTYDTIMNKYIPINLTTGEISVSQFDKVDDFKEMIEGAFDILDFYEDSNQYSM